MAHEVLFGEKSIDLVGYHMVPSTNWFTWSIPSICRFKGQSYESPCQLTGFETSHSIQHIPTFPEGHGSRGKIIVPSIQPTL